MRLQADAGVSPVVAVVLLMGLVAVAGAIIGLSMVAALEDAAGTLPDVRFQASADNQSLYHAGGDALPLKNLVFYDTSTRESPQSVQLTKNGQTEAKTSLEGEVWETGDKITFGANVLKALSIVGLDSRNHPALLYRGVDAAVLPIGDMVPDAWKETTPTPIGPTPVPTPEVVPTPSGEDTTENKNDFNPNDKLLFGTMNLIQDKILNKNPSSPYQIEEGVTQIRVEFDSQNSNKNQKMYVVVYDQQNNIVGQGDPNPVDIALNADGTSNIPTEILKKGYHCKVTIEIYNKNTNELEYRGTTTITIA